MLVVVLTRLGVSISGVESASHTPSMTLLGRLAAWPPSLGEIEASVGAFVWHVPPAPGRLDALEVEQWLVDAPAGEHWIISERPVSVRLERLTRGGVRCILWPRERLATVVGEAVLDGQLSVARVEGPAVADASMVSLVSRATSQSSGDGPLVFAPAVRIRSWFERSGLEQRPHRAILLEARLWRVEGELVADDGRRDRSIWHLLDDPWLGELDHAPMSKLLGAPPRLERVPSPGAMDAWHLRVQLPRLCDTRREVRPDGFEDMIGGVLEPWRLETDTAELTAHDALIPAWWIDMPGGERQLLHGLIGEVVRASGRTARASH